MSNNLSDRTESANLINPNSARVRPLKEGVACVGVVVDQLLHVRSRLQVVFMAQVVSQMLSSAESR